ncbi:glycosyltransferase family 2 protein [Ferruginibacter paludis]|uniref:glycosyltransferase family 2 protein n=1 Tax=Ferruginibacter paludis TaxID=1310417 RepID=UPI0025B44507|nr:glycosyltransferase family 2 protein [Ferruginibacter paludis]MDN3657618.1 glycosyltransferase family 2 protein [Ferruginibacter paludis]
MVNQNTDFFQIADNFKEHINTPSFAIIASTVISDSKITVAITTYKRPDLLKISLDSVVNQAGNFSYDIVVVDDDPTRETETEKLMESYRGVAGLSYYKNKQNLGLFGNWNRCIELTKSEYLTILNDDDWLDLHYLNRVIAFIRAKPATDLLLVGIEVMKEGKTLTPPDFKYKKKIDKIFFIEFLYGNINPGSLGILLKTDMAKKIGGFNNLFFPTSDVVFLINYLATAKHAYRTSEKLAYYRLSVNESFKTSVQVSNIKYDKILRSQLMRKIPSLKFIIKLALPVFDYYQFERVCDYSAEFNTLYSSEKIPLKQKIKGINRLAYYFLLVVRRVSLKLASIFITGVKKV